jgi:hypothetical protein
MQNMCISKCKYDYICVCVFSTYDVLMWGIYIYILTKYVQWSWLVLHKTIQFSCIKHEHSCMSFKKNVSSIWVFKILNMYTYCSY